jgi:hypothetical protein
MWENAMTAARALAGAAALFGLALAGCGSGQPNYQANGLTFAQQMIAHGAQPSLFLGAGSQATEAWCQSNDNGQGSGTGQVAPDGTWVALGLPDIVQPSQSGYSNWLIEIGEWMTGCESGAAGL